MTACRLCRRRSRRMDRPPWWSWRTAARTRRRRSRRRCGARVLVREHSRERGKGFALASCLAAAPSGAESTRSRWSTRTRSSSRTSSARSGDTCAATRRRAGARSGPQRGRVGAHPAARARAARDEPGAAARSRTARLARSACSATASPCGATRSSRCPFSGRSITEDLDHHLRLVLAGRRARFVDSTTVWSDMATSGGEAREPTRPLGRRATERGVAMGAASAARDRGGTLAAGRAAAGPAHASARLSRRAALAARWCSPGRPAGSGLRSDSRCSRSTSRSPRDSGAGSAT